ncbi:hypothetical protein IV203_008138 [Nitzschia inconspicua]|uniref:Uncharacterized protein n=1 Tax=Nitzschia inconspicua TaxID=303405 RepID=A0A9K3PLN6_9STRA|nr:hypothetical protein IV203_008138 [Nitzschia inconspicua]
MQPRIFQLHSAPTRAVSPALSDWSPMVSNPMDQNEGRTTGQTTEIVGFLDLEDEPSFPCIRRSFAFDEWDEEEEEAEDIASNYSNNDEEQDPRCEPEALAVIPTFENGRIIYDATHCDSSYSHFQSNPTSFDTYMIVIHLDDTKLLRTSSTTSTSTETIGDPNLRTKFTCPSILRQSITYRWGSGYSFQQKNKLHSSDRPSSYQVLETNGYYETGTNEKLSRESSSTSDHPFPVPEYVVVYKTE